MTDPAPAPAPVVVTVTVRGTVPLKSKLPSSGNKSGDAYIVLADSSLWYWFGGAWTEIDISGQITRISTRAKFDIQASAALILTQTVNYQPPLPKVIPWRNFRAVMDDYRVVQGMPVRPPILDCFAPIITTVNTHGVAIPNTKRPLPEEIGTAATLRWIASDPYVTYSEDSSQMWWVDRSGTQSWTAFEEERIPLLDEDYNYRVPRNNRATEIFYRSAFVFVPTAGNSMNTSLSINPYATVDAIEFFFVLSCHDDNSNVLDIGDSVQGFFDMPFGVADSISGARQRVIFRSSDSARLQQGHRMLTVPVTAMTTGRPVIIRARFGQWPLIEQWGPHGRHHKETITKKDAATDPVNLATNYVLGRQRGQVAEDTNAGMHLFEIDYYDHGLERDDVELYVNRLSRCYGVTD